MHCKKCGSEILDSEALFCTVCGEKLELIPEEDVQYCRNCGKRLSAKAIVCDRCCQLTGVNAPTGPVRADRKNKGFIVTSIIASILQWYVLGALFVIIGLTGAINNSQRKTIKLGIFAIVLCAVMCLWNILTL